MRYTGVTARGIISPIFRQGDDLSAIVCKSILNTSKGEGFSIEDGDIIGITESVVARTQGNYATCEQIAADVRQKFGGGVLGAVFPILSRNRFSVLLKAIAAGCDKLVLQLSFPKDEVGNALISDQVLYEKKVNIYSGGYTEEEFIKEFGGATRHPFTGVDYIELYKGLAPNIELVFSNDPAYILNYSKNVLCCDIHTRARTRAILQDKDAELVYGMDDILSESVDGSGFNEQYGILGSNKATEESVKLFPRDSEKLVEEIQSKMRELTGKIVEVLVYGDGCFKDPVGGIWEFADPVVAPAFTSGLAGTPNELKMKYFADNEFAGLSGEELNKAVRDKVSQKDASLVGSMQAQGTTPRRYTDLIGSLCDLISGSGDRGTPVVYIKGYFTNYAT